MLNEIIQQTLGTGEILVKSIYTDETKRIAVNAITNPHKLYDVSELLVTDTRVAPKYNYNEAENV